CAYGFVMLAGMQRLQLAERRIEMVPTHRVLQVDHALRRDRVRIVERACLDHDELSGEVARSVEPSAAGSAEMPRYLTAGFADIGEGRGFTFDGKLAAVDADDRRVAGAGRFLAVLAAAL